MTNTVPSTTGDPHARLGTFLLGAGALGLVATCISYVLAGPEAALPGGASSTAAAIAATSQAAGWMRAAGLFGMPSDVLLAVGALLLASQAYRRGTAPLVLAGWLSLAIAGALFIVVDAMVAMVLPLAAAQPTGEAAYASLRALFDVLFTIGAWTAGGGALALAWRNDGVLFQWPAVGWGMRGAGVIGLLASSAHLLGWPGAPLIGPGIAVLALASLGAAIAYTRQFGSASGTARHAALEPLDATNPW